MLDGIGGSSGSRQSQAVDSNTNGARGSLAAAGSANGGVVTGAMQPVLTRAGTSAEIGNNVHITAGNAFRMRADENVGFNSYAGAIAGGFVGVGASITIANVGSQTNASIGDNAIVSAGGDISLASHLKEKSVAFAFGGSGGAVAVGAQVAVINDNSTQRSHVGNGVQILRANTVDVAASNERVVEAWTLSVGGGAIAAGAAISVAGVEGGSEASMGSVLIGQDPANTVNDVHVSANSNSVGKAWSIGVRGGAISLNGVVSVVSCEPYVKSTVGPNAHIKVANDVVVESIDQTTAKSEAYGGSFGAVAVGATVAVAHTNPAITTALEGDDIVAGRDVIVRTLHQYEYDSSTGTWKPMSASEGAHEENIGAVGIVMSAAGGAGFSARGGAVASDLFERGLCLPSGSSMTDEDVVRVAAEVVATSPALALRAASAQRAPRPPAAPSPSATAEPASIGK